MFSLVCHGTQLSIVITDILLAWPKPCTYGCVPHLVCPDQRLHLASPHACFSPAHATHSLHCAPTQPHKMGNTGVAIT